METLTGALHVHSTYSDGEFTLRELRDLFAAVGCRFACVTDHAEYFDARRLQQYARECELLSSDGFLLIPGLELGCERRMHVLGYGVTALWDGTDPQEAIRFIEAAGGVSVIAHPADGAFPWIETFERLPMGLEVWNTKYDGRYAPRPQTFALLDRLRRRQPDLRAFYGQDLHWRTQYRGLLTRVRAPDASRDGILTALRDGAFLGAKDALLLPSSGGVHAALLARFEKVQRRSALLRRWLKGAARLSGGLAGLLPAPIKAQIRRLT